MHVSHETIYKSLFIQARGTLKKELTQHLRTNRLMRVNYLVFHVVVCLVNKKAK